MQPGHSGDPDTTRQIERLRDADIPAQKTAVIAIRRNWLHENRPRLGLAGPVLPRRAYEILFRDYMELPLADLPGSPNPRPR